ncbi:MAG: hypothetical protein H0T73_09830 [Ardenticatenales bacterium]|nr:hypothetical protein [Ardenticatenales bacterium]
MSERAAIAPRYLLWLFPSTPALLFLLIFWVGLLFAPPMLNSDGDLGRHITLGRYMLSSRQIPTEDLFSHTMAGAHMVPHEWLSQLLFALAHEMAGLNGVVWLTMAVLAGSYALLGMGMRGMGIRSPLVLAGVLFAAMTGALHWLTRPHIFTFFFFTAFFLILERYRQSDNSGWLLLLLPLMVLWANIHGAFVIGFILVIVYGLGLAMEGRHEAALKLLMGVLPTLLVLAASFNPVGPELVQHSFAYPQQRFLVNVTVEYQSPDFHSPSSWFFAALLLGAVGLGWLLGRRLAWTPLLLLLLWAAFALYSARNIPLFALVAVPILAREVDEWLNTGAPAIARSLGRMDEIDRQSWGWMWSLGVVALLMAVQAAGTPLDVWREGNRFSPSAFPVGAVDVLSGKLPEGEMFNEFAWGGYLLYHLWPEERVFIDAQTDFYGEALTREFLQVAEAEPGWEALLEQRGVRWVILPPTRPLVRWLAQTPGWVQVYKDETAEVWERQN